MLTDTMKIFEMTVTNTEKAVYGTLHIVTKSLDRAIEAVRVKFGKDCKITKITEIPNVLFDTSF